jgi:hypothetical protein
MTADEIFVLLLVVVCVGALVAAEVRSRRQKPAAEPAGISDRVPESQPDVVAPDPPRAASDRKRRRGR